MTQPHRTIAYGVVSIGDSAALLLLQMPQVSRRVTGYLPLLRVSLAYAAKQTCPSVARVISMHCPSYGHWVSLGALVRAYPSIPYRRLLGLVANGHASLRAPHAMPNQQVYVLPSGRYALRHCPIAKPAEVRADNAPLPGSLVSNGDKQNNETTLVSSRDNAVASQTLVSNGDKETSWSRGSWAGQLDRLLGNMS